MKNGVQYEDGMWVAYVDGALVASGPDKAIVQAAFDYHNTEDED
jgi:hypothetical protein